MTQKTIHDLYREGKFQSQEQSSQTNYASNKGYVPIPPQRARKGYWVGFWLGFLLQLIPGVLIAWAIQSGIDRNLYIGRYVIGSIHGWIASWPIWLFLALAVMMLNLQ